MKEAYGVPVVESVEEFVSMPERLGIKPWVQKHPPMGLDAYRAVAHTADLLAELNRFAPKGEVMLLEQPDGKPFTGFRSVGRDWASVFALVPDPDYPLQEERRMMPVVVEWKHGAEIIAITPPCGVPKKGESMEECGRREFTEETGFELDGEVEALTPEPIAVSGRQTTQSYMPFLGYVKEPVVRGPSRLDDTEFLKLIFVPLSVWVQAMEAGLVRECSAISTTYLAMRRLGLISFRYPYGSGRIKMMI